MAVCEGEGFRPSLLAPRAPTVNRPEPRHRKLLSLLGWFVSVENYWSHGGLLVYRDWWWPPFAPRAECFQLARLYQITPRVWRVGELKRFGSVSC